MVGCCCWVVVPPPLSLSPIQHNLTDWNYSSALCLSEVCGIRIRFCNLQYWNTAFANLKLFDPLHEIWLMHVTFLMWCTNYPFFFKGNNQHTLLSAHCYPFIGSTWTFCHQYNWASFAQALAITTCLCETPSRIMVGTLTVLMEVLYSHFL